MLRHDQKLLLAFLELLADFLVKIMRMSYKQGLGSLFIHDVFAIEGLFKTLTAHSAVSKNGQDPEHPQKNADATA